MGCEEHEFAETVHATDVEVYVTVAVAQVNSKAGLVLPLVANAQSTPLKFTLAGSSRLPPVNASLPMLVIPGARVMCVMLVLLKALS